MIKGAVRHNDPELTSDYSIIYKALDQKEINVKKSVVVENHTDIYLNNTHFIRLNCSPIQVEELALGHLYAKGTISDINDVSNIDICENGTIVNVCLNSNSKQKNALLKSIPKKKPIKERHHKGTLRNISFKKRSLHFWKYDDIFHLASTFHAGSPLYLETRGVHSCTLCMGRKILFRCEDISRHNALDKAIGYVFKNRIDVSEAILFSSGRIPADTVAKVIKIGIPILVSNSVPTKQAIELARHHNLTLLGEVKNEKICVYSR